MNTNNNSDTSDEILLAARDSHIAAARNYYPNLPPPKIFKKSTGRPKPAAPDIALSSVEPADSILSTVSIMERGSSDKWAVDFLALLSEHKDQ